MGSSDSKLNGDKKAVGDVVAPTELVQVDVSEDIQDTEQNDGENRFRITLLCEKKNTRLAPDDIVQYSLSDDKRNLQVTVGNRIFHRVRLPGAVNSCQINTKRSRNDDLIIITLEKSDPKIWTKG